MKAHVNSFNMVWDSNLLYGYFTSTETHCRVSMGFNRLKLIPPPKSTKKCLDTFGVRISSTGIDPHTQSKMNLDWMSHYSMQNSTFGTVTHPSKNEPECVDVGLSDSIPYEISVPESTDVVCQKCVVCGTVLKEKVVYPEHFTHFSESYNPNFSTTKFMISSSKGIRLTPMYIECLIRKDERHANKLKQFFDKHKDEYEHDRRPFISKITIQSNNPYVSFHSTLDNYSEIDDCGDFFILNIVFGNATNYSDVGFGGIFPTALKVASASIGFSLTPVAPMGAPMGVIPYMDTYTSNMVNDISDRIDKDILASMVKRGKKHKHKNMAKDGHILNPTKGFVPNKKYINPRVNSFIRKRIKY